MGRLREGYPMGKWHEKMVLGDAAEERATGLSDWWIWGPKNVFPLTDPEPCLTLYPRADIQLVHTGETIPDAKRPYASLLVSQSHGPCLSLMPVP